jgi:hypothetical protein
VGNFHNEAEVGPNHLLTGCAIPSLDPLSESVLIGTGE